MAEALRVSPLEGKSPLVDMTQCQDITTNIDTDISRWTRFQNLPQPEFKVLSFTPEEMAFFTDAHERVKRVVDTVIESLGLPAEIVYGGRKSEPCRVYHNGELVGEGVVNGRVTRRGLSSMRGESVNRSGVRSNEEVAILTEHQVFLALVERVYPLHTTYGVRLKFVSASSPLSLDILTVDSASEPKQPDKAETIRRHCGPDPVVGRSSCYQYQWTEVHQNGKEYHITKHYTCHRLSGKPVQSDYEHSPWTDCAEVPTEKSVESVPANAAATKDAFSPESPVCPSGCDAKRSQGPCRLEYCRCPCPNCKKDRGEV